MTTKTFRLSGLAVEREWRVLDAKGRPLGRVASEAAQLLLGKHKPTFEPHLPMGDFVVVLNAKDVDLTGQKSAQKRYYRHTGYPGGLRERSFAEQMARDPRRIVEKAVKGMLPHNAHGRALLRGLKVYPGPEHPHEAQFAAGTGARAKKRAAQAEAKTAATKPRRQAAAAAEAAPAAKPAPAGERLQGALSKYRREELDAEAERLGLTVEKSWNKPDVIAAIQRHYDENP